MNTTGQRIRSLREERGWSQSKFLVELHRVIPDDKSLVRETLSKLENDVNMPSAWVTIALVEVLETSADYLLCLSDDPYPLPESEQSPYVKLIRNLNTLSSDTRSHMLDTFYRIIELTTTTTSTTDTAAPVQDNIIQLTAPPQSLEELFEYLEDLDPEVRDIVVDWAERQHRIDSEKRQSRSNQL